MNGELLRLIDVLHREKEIDKEVLFDAIEGAVSSAIKKRHDPTGEIEVIVDRQSGAIQITEDGVQVEYPDMGRIQAQTAKQVIIQKIREAEQDVIYAEYQDKVGLIVNGNVQRIEEILRGVPFAHIGQVTQGLRMVVTGRNGRRVIDEDIFELKEAWQKPLRW